MNKRVQNALAGVADSFLESCQGILYADREYRCPSHRIRVERIPGAQIRCYTSPVGSSDAALSKNKQKSRAAVFCPSLAPVPSASTSSVLSVTGSLVTVLLRARSLEQGDMPSEKSGKRLRNSQAFFVERMNTGMVLFLTYGQDKDQSVTVNSSRSRKHPSARDPNLSQMGTYNLHLKCSTQLRKEDEKNRTRGSQQFSESGPGEKVLDQTMPGHAAQGFPDRLLCRHGTSKHKQLAATEPDFTLNPEQKLYCQWQSELGKGSCELVDAEVLVMTLTYSLSISNGV